MPQPKIGSSYKFSDLMKAYGADQQRDEDAHFLLYRGTEILALCLRYKFNPKPNELWVGNDPAVSKWGERLASLKGKQSVPLFYSEKSRTLYTFKGNCLINDATDAPEELAKRKGPVPLSLIVLIEVPGAGRNAP